MNVASSGKRGPADALQDGRGAGCLCIAHSGPVIKADSDTPQHVSVQQLETVLETCPCSLLSPVCPGPGSQAMAHLPNRRNSALSACITVIATEHLAALHPFLPGTKSTCVSPARCATLAANSCARQGGTAMSAAKSCAAVHSARR